MEKCSGEYPELIKVSDTHSVSCYLYEGGVVPCERDKTQVEPTAETVKKATKQRKTDTVQLVHLAVNGGFALLQSYGVGVQRSVKYVFRRTGFYYLARIHYHNVVRHFGNHAKVVGNQQ